MFIENQKTNFISHIFVTLAIIVYVYCIFKSKFILNAYFVLCIIVL